MLLFPMQEVLPNSPVDGFCYFNAELRSHWNTIPQFQVDFVEMVTPFVDIN